MVSSNRPKPKLIYLITKGNWGGAQKYVYQLAVSPLIRRSFDIEVVCGVDGELVERLRQKGVHVTVIPQKNRINPFGSLLEIMRLRSFLIKRAPDMIHLNSSKMGLVGSLAGRLAGVPHIVFTAHGWTFNENRTLVMRLFLRGLFYLIVSLSSLTICVAKEVKRQLHAPRFLKKRIVIIYNGLEKTLYPKLPKLSEGSSVVHVVSVGDLHSNKGQDTVLKILPHIENIHYHIIGEGPLRPTIEKMITKKDLGTKVTLYGHVFASPLLSQYDVLIQPSRTEALPYVPLEALAAGLPVIARAVGGIPEIVEGVPHAKLYKDDSELIEILKDIPKVKSLWNDPRFDVETMTKKTLYEYNNLIEAD